MTTTSVQINQLIQSIKESFSDTKKNDNFTALHEPLFIGNEWNYVKECLDTGWVSSVGKYVDLFEEKLAEFTGVRKAVAVVNGTAALHIALLLADVQEGDEVLMPTLTFIATANAVSYCGAVPHFIDTDERLGIDISKLELHLHQTAEMKNGECYNKRTGRRIKAIVPMHTFGHPVDVDPLLQLCNDYKLGMIEDAAESLGSYYKGRHTGHWGKVSAVSFNGNKIITTGGGGAILTNDESLGDLAKHLTTTAKIPHRWDFVHDRIGYNYRLPNLNAALGCAQMEKLPEYLAKKRRLFEQYEMNLKALEGITLLKEPSFAKSNYWLNTIILNKSDMRVRNEILTATNDAGIMSRPVWTLMHKLPMFADCPKMDLSAADDMEMRVINIPSSVILGEAYSE